MRSQLLPGTQLKLLRTVPQEVSLTCAHRYRNWASAWQMYHKTCMTSKDSDQPAHPPSMARVLVYPSLNSLNAVEGTCDQQRLWSDCTDAQADLSLRWSHVLLLVLSCAGSIILSTGTDWPEQTVKAKIRRHRMRRLFSVYTVCHLIQQFVEKSAGSQKDLQNLEQKRQGVKVSQYLG